MSNTPSDEELTACYREANGEMHGKAQPLTTQRIFRAMRAAIVKWGTPQPVVREPLTDAQIAEMMRETWGCASIAPRHAVGFARAIEAEVRKQDDALILQLVEALEDLAGAGEEAWSEERPCVRIGKEVATAGRARLEGKT